MKLERMMGALVVLGAINTGCGIDLADTTEGLDQETLEGEGANAAKDNAPKECRVASGDFFGIKDLCGDRLAEKPTETRRKVARWKDASERGSQDESKGFSHLECHWRQGSKRPR